MAASSAPLGTRLSVTALRSHPALMGVGPRPVLGVAVLSALLIGVLMANGAVFAVALLVAVLYAPVAFVNFPLGVALWFPTVFVSYYPGLADPAHAAALLLGIVWVGTLVAGRGHVRPALSEHRFLFAAVGALALWLLLSLTWSETPGDGLFGLVMWAPPIFLFGMIVTRISTEQHLRWLAYAFIAGAVGSVLLGLVANGLSTSASAIDTATRQEGRLQGGSGDPNILAAGIVPAIAFAAALAVGARTLSARIWLGGAIAILGLGIAATESRGGLIAMVIALFAAVAVAKGRRGAIIVLAALTLGGAAVWFVNTPSGWERITTFDGGGNGRSDLWNVAWDMGQDHPIVGVGLSNYQDRAADYVRRPREIQFVELIAEKPHVVHNTYLQLWAETGLIGLLLFLGVATTALQTALRAARSFDAQGDDGLATLSRAVFVGILALLAASLFLTNGHDSRLWLLFGMSAALLALAASRRTA